jgi:branched-chain amino acid transport system substrate-binding protein
VSISTGQVLKPAGFDNSTDWLGANYGKDPSDPAFKDDKDILAWLAFMKKYYPEGDINSTFNIYGAGVAATMVQVLQQAGNNLTRENVMKEAANLKNFRAGTLLEGILINTSPTNYYPIQQMQMMKFNGERWVFFGPIISGEVK